MFATFISTLGEGSFVLLGASDEADVAGNLKAYATITVFGLLAGIIFGYLFDVSGFRANYDNNQEKQAENHTISTKQNTLIGCDYRKYWILRHHGYVDIFSSRIHHGFVGWRN